MREIVASNFLVDAENPGWVIGYGVIDEANKKLIDLRESESMAKGLIKADGVRSEAYVVRRVSHQPGTDNYMLAE